MERQQEEFKRIQNYRSYSAINPTISDDNKNETKERVGMMRMQRRHSYDIKYYKRELDHQAYPPSPPETIITNNSTSTSCHNENILQGVTLGFSSSGPNVTENFLFRKEWDDEISKRKYKNKS
ncbi:15673_t:CDS:2 [Entrophospora sp. SA101]|nr:15673_t:CDS:2 [Entrophospora sp. SA101]